MLITPLQLADEPLLLDESLREGAIDYTPDIRQIGPLKLQGRAELIVEHRGPREFVEDIRLRAHFDGSFELLCARCLEPVTTPLTGDFDLIYRPVSVETEAGEHAITEDETEIGYYEKSGLLLEDAVREQVLLSLPGRALCQEDCKGLCPQCGANRNLADCGCGEALANPRWNALAGIALGDKP
ncbi:MAG TPA: DUF177 domain-containing protein [Acidobacteriaceae bacterium]|jgi:uncharacterized protein|nr:DUF177 domain-containing protein [Acidobacteriaceae bacterium]